MEKLNTLKILSVSIFGLIGSFLAQLLGGWDMALQTLVLFMAVDYITGLIVAGVFKKSTKTANGAMESKAGFKGLCKKGMILLYVLVAAQVDKFTGTEIVRNAVVIGFAANEALSILENGGLMGIRYPEILKNAIDLLINKPKEGSL
ncbi:MAG TPA: phage holin family protein [Clostridiales bacterium]|nr:phage holin family protein [Clostridiales bacterium]